MSMGEFNQAWKHDLETDDTTLLIEAPWDVSYVAYSRSGRYRVSGINADARIEVTIVDTETGLDLTLPEVATRRFCGMSSSQPTKVMSH